MLDFKALHYTDLCRGRYLCEEHDGFCDGADDYAEHCVACGKIENPEGKWSANRIDRILHLVNGMQKRSMRNASFVTLIFGGIGAWAILSKLALRDQGEAILNLSVYPFFLQLGLASLLLCVGFYSSSMQHIPIVDRGEHISLKDYEVWSKNLETHLGKLERRHRFAGLLFIVGVVFFFLSLVLPLALYFTPRLDEFFRTEYFMLKH